MTLAQTAGLPMPGLFVGMLALSDVGRCAGRYKLARDPDGFGKGIGAAEAAVFALLGLLIAYTFSAAPGFEVRRHLITDEANAIGTGAGRLAHGSQDDFAGSELGFVGVMIDCDSPPPP